MSDTFSNISVSEIGNFIYTSLIAVILILFYFFIGNCVLYSCKAAQSNIFPTDEKCFPYTETESSIQSIITNIYITFTSPALSEKLKFPSSKENLKDFLIDRFREYKNQYDANNLVMYVISLFEGLLSLNFKTLDNIFNLLNKVPELGILLLGPIIYLLLFGFLFIINCFYLMYLWFANMKWIFKTNSNKSRDRKPKWTDISILNIFSYAIAMFIAFMLTIGFFVLLLFGWGVLPVITTLWSLISIFTSTITNIIGVYVIYSAFTTMNSTLGIAALLVFVLMHFGIITSSFFEKDKIISSLTPLVSNSQAIKKCTGKISSQDANSFDSLDKGIFGKFIDAFIGGGSMYYTLQKMKELNNQQNNQVNNQQNNQVNK
jgi:hypothetical protein